MPLNEVLYANDVEIRLSKSRASSQTSAFRHATEFRLKLYGVQEASKVCYSCALTGWITTGFRIYSNTDATSVRYLASRIGHL